MELLLVERALLSGVENGFMESLANETKNLPVRQLIEVA